jgi:hypothetical protein
MNSRPESSSHVDSQIIGLRAAPDDIDGNAGGHTGGGQTGGQPETHSGGHDGPKIASWR